jgi:hypothetical protein
MSFKKPFILFLLLGSALALDWSCSSNNNPSTAPAPVTIYYVPATSTSTPPKPTSTPSSPTLSPTRGHPGPTDTPTPTPTGSATPTTTLTPLPGITPVYTFGQSGTNGIDGDFDSAWGVAVGQGFIAVGDFSTNNVQVFNVGSSGTTYLYSIPANNPQGLAIDSYGELYIVNEGLGEVDGYYLTASAATSYTYDYTWNGQGLLSDPIGVKIDAGGNLVVSDNASGIIYNLLWNDDSILHQTTGTPSAIYPNDVALDASGNIYTAAGNEVVKFNNTYTYANSFTGSNWATALSYAIGVGVDSFGNLYISDANNDRVVYATAQGAYLGEIDGLDYPAFLALDNANDLFVVNYVKHMVDEFHGY